MGPLTAPDPTAQVTKPAPSGINSVQKPADTSRWQAQLESMLRKHKQYPMVARRMRQEGIVTVEAHFSAHGELIRCMVIISSGFKSLDEAALALVRQTADLVRASDQPGRSAELRIPIAFELKES
jgi:periplasmic protein TonB